MFDRILQGGLKKVRVPALKLLRRLCIGVLDLLEAGAEEPLELRERGQPTGGLGSCQQERGSASVSTFRDTVRAEGIVQSKPWLVVRLRLAPEVELRRSTEKTEVIRMSLQSLPERGLSCLRILLRHGLLSTKEKLIGLGTAKHAQSQAKHEQQAGDDRLHREYDTRSVLRLSDIRARSLRGARATALLLSTVGLLMLQPLGARADEPDVLLPFPSLRWAKDFGVLRVRVLPSKGTQLATELGIHAILDDDAYFRVEWGTPDIPESGPGRIVLPLVRARDSAGWRLEVRGGICSEDKSKCLPFTARTQVPSGAKLTGRFKAEPAVSAASTPSPSSLQLGSSGNGLSVPGTSRVQQAFAEAKARDLPLLVGFFADWCPPCDRLRQEFLQSPTHAGFLSDFVALQLNADLPESFNLKERYSVEGYPTLLVLDNQGTLLDRVVGWPGSANALVDRLGQSLASNDESTSPIRTKTSAARQALALGEPGRAWGLLLEAYPRLLPGLQVERVVLDMALSIARVLEEAGVRDEGGEYPVAELALALADSAPAPGEAAGYVDIAARHVADTGNERRAAELHERYGEQLRAALGARLPAELVPVRGDLDLSMRYAPGPASKLDDSASLTYHLACWEKDEERRLLLFAEAALRMAAAIRSELSSPEFLPLEDDGRLRLHLTKDLLDGGVSQALARQSGRVHDLVSLLKRAERNDLAEQVVRKMIELLPDESTWHYKLGLMLSNQERWSESTAALEAAALHASGDDSLRTAIALAQVQLAMGRAEEARRTVQSALSQPRPAEERIRTHRYRLTLNELRKQIQTALSDERGGPQGLEVPR